LKTKKEIRQAKEKKTRGDIAFPGYDALDEEMMEQAPRVWVTVKDQSGNVIRRVEGPTKKGFHRIAWDLRYPTPNAVTIVPPPPPMFGEAPKGMLAPPGKYTATLHQQVDGGVIELSEPIEFEVVPLREGALKGASLKEVSAFWRSYEKTVRDFGAIQMTLGHTIRKSKRMKEVLLHSQTPAGDFDNRLHAIQMELMKLNQDLNGNMSRQQPGEKTNRATIGYRLFKLEIGVGNSTYGPTTQHKQGIDIINKKLSETKTKVEASKAKLSQLAKDLVKAGGPWIEGEDIPE